MRPHVTLICALTADGYIARDDHHLSDWTGDADTDLFHRLTNEIGVLVMGKNTYDTLPTPLAGRRVIVVTNTANLDGVETYSGDVTQLLAQLADDGVEAVALCGGRDLNSQFLAAGLIDEMHLTISSVVFGQGLTLFDTRAACDLELVASARLDDSTMHLQYRSVQQ